MHGDQIRRQIRLVARCLAALLTLFSAVNSPAASADEGDAVCSGKWPLPTSIEVRFEGELRSSLQSAICRGVSEFGEAMSIQGAFPEAVIYVYPTIDEAIAKWARITRQSNSAASRFWIRDSTRLSGAAIGRSVVIRTTIRTSEALLIGLTAHELLHVLQDAHRVPVDEYWMREGSARYVGYMVQASSGWSAPVEQVIESRRPFAVNREFPHPRDIRRRSAFIRERDAYRVAELAFNFLVEDVGFDAYSSCYLLGGGSFEGCFDTTIDEFYERYSRYVEAGYVTPEDSRIAWCADGVWWYSTEVLCMI